jgi:hypothetical protein
MVAAEILPFMGNSDKYTYEIWHLDSFVVFILPSFLF